MEPISALNHSLNFFAPALALALALVACGAIFWRKRPQVGGLISQFAIQLIVGCAVLLTGLLLLGRDGRMATYAALVLVAASVQWGLLRGWRE